MVGTTVYYLHQDALGNTRLETTTTVSVKFSSNYVPYGKNYAVSGKEVFMYTGKPYDSATGLYYEGARYYDPTTGRFITQDSITGVQEDPMSLNRYIYARDNPMRYIDPNGHASQQDFWNFITSTINFLNSIQSTIANLQNLVKAHGTAGTTTSHAQIDSEGVTTVTATTQSMDFATWFENSYSHNPQFLSDSFSIIATILTILFPDLTGWTGSLQIAFNKVVNTGGGLVTLTTMVQDEMAGNTKGALSNAIQLGSTLLQTWWGQVLSGWQKFTFAIETAGYEVGNAISGDTIQTLMDVGNTVVLGYDFAVLITDTQSSWNQYQVAGS